MELISILLLAKRPYNGEQNKIRDGISDTRIALSTLSVYFNPFRDE